MSSSFENASKRAVKSVKRKSYSRDIRKLLKSIDPDLSISAMGLNILDSFVEDLLRRIANEASELTKHAGRSTMNKDDIISATSLVIPSPELSKNAVRMANKTIQYTSKSK